jgi:hypothetical protein
MNSPKARARPPPSSSPVLEEEEASEIIPRRKLAASSSSSSSSTDAEDNDLLLTLPFVATDNAPKDSVKNDDDDYDDDDEYNGDTLPSTTAKKLRNKDFSNSPASRDLSSDDSSEDSPEDEDVPAKKLIRRRSGGRKAKTTTPAVKKSKKKVNSKRSSAKKTSPNKKKKAIQGSDESGESSSDSSSDSGSGSGSSLGGAKVVTDSELSDVTILDREERSARKRRSTLTASKNKSNSKAAADVDDEEEDDEKRKADDPLSSAKSPSGIKSNKGKSNQNLWTVDDELREEKIEEARSQLRTQYEERGIDYDNDADMVDGLDDRRLVESARLAFADSPLAVAALATIRKLRAEKEKKAKAAASKGLNNQLEMKKEGEEEEEEGENKKLDGDLHLEDTPAVAAAADADAKTVDDLAPTAPSEDQVPVLSTTATIEAAAEEEEEEEVITKVDENLVTMQEAEITSLGHQPAAVIPLFHSPQEELDPETGTVTTTALTEKNVGTNEVLNVIAAVDKALDDAQMDLEEAITTSPSDALVVTQLLDTTSDALMIEGIARDAAVATPDIINEDKDGNASSSSSSDSSESSSDSSESESDDDLDKKTRAAEKAALAVHVRIVGLQERFRIVRQALLLRLLKRIDLITNAQVEPENPHLLLENRLEEQRAMSTAHALVKDAVRKRKEEVMKQRAIEMAENARITELHFRHTSPTLGHHHQLQQQQQQQQPNQFHSGVAGGSPNSPSRNLVFNVSTAGASGVGLTSLTKLSDVSQLLNTQHALTTQDTQLFQPQDATGAAKDTEWIVFSDDDDDDDDDEEEEEEEDNVNENKQSEAPARTSQSTSDVLVVDNNFTQQIGSEGPDPITTSTSVLPSSLSGSTVDAEKAVDQQALSSSSSFSSPPPATTLPVYTGPSVAHIEKIMKILDDEFQAQDEQLIKLAREAKEAYKREKDKYIARRLHVLLKRREEKSKSRILMGLESEDSDQEEIDKKALREQIEQEELNNEELNAILLSNYLPSMLREMSKVTDSIRSGGGGGGGSSSSSNDATATAYATAAAAHDVLARRAHSELGRLNAAIAPNSSDSFINSSSSSGRVSSKHISSDKQRKLLRSELQIAQMRLTSQVQARQDNLKFNDMAAKLIASARGMLNKNKNERDRELRAKLIAAKIATGVLDKPPAPSPEETVVTSSEIVEEMAEEGDDEEESDDEGGENGDSDDDEDDSDYNEGEEKEEEKVKEKQVHDAEMTTSSSASALDDSLIDVRTSSSSEVAMNSTDAPLLKSSSSTSSASASASIKVDNSKTAIPSAVSLDGQNDEIAHSVEEVPQASIKKTSAVVVSSGPLAKMFAVQEKKAIALKEKKEAKIAKAAKVKAVKGASSSSSSGDAAAEDDEVLQISEDEDALERLLAREHGEDDDDDDEEEEEEEDDEEEVVEKTRVKSRLTRFSKLEKGNDDDDASSVSSSDIAKKTTIHASTEESDDDFEEEAENVSDSDVSSLQPTTTTTATTQKLVIFDDEDEEYEKQREAERLKLEAEEEEAERLANPKTFLDMIRAEDAEARNRGGKGSRRNRHIEQEAELSEDDDAVGLDQFGAQNQLLGNDRKLVTKIIEEEEEKREALLDEKALKELQAAVVDEVDETEKALDGQQASLFAMQREAEDRKLETKVKKAVARGEHQSLLRGKRKRRGGREGGSDSEDAADEEDGENELNAVEKMRKRMGQEYIVEDEEEEDEDDDDEGDEEGVSSDTDEDFDFEAAMKKRTKEERLAAAAERERDLGDTVDEDGRLKKRSSWRKGGGDSQRGLTQEVQEVQEDERDVEARAALTQVNTAIKSVVDIFTNRGNEEDDEDDEEEEEEKKNDLHKKGIEKDLDKAAADHSNSRKGSGHFVEGNSNSNKNSSQVFSSSSSSSLRALSSTTSATTTTTGGASSTTIKDMFRSSSDPSRAAPPSLIAGATISSSSSAAAISSNRGGSFFGNKLLMGSATAGVGGTAEPPLWRVPSLSANVSVPAIRVAIETASSSSSSSLSSSNPTPIAGSKSLGESVSIPQQQQQRSNSSEGNTPIAGATLLAMPQQQQQQHSSKSRGEDSMRPPPSRNPAMVRNGGQLPSNFAGFLPRSNTLNAPGGLSALSSSTAPVQNPLKSTFALPLSEMISATAGVDSGLSRSAMPFLSSSDQFGGGGGGASSSAFFSASASGLSLGGRADSRIPSAFQPGFSASLGGFGVNSSSSSSSFSSSSFSSSSAANRGFVYGAGKSASTNGEAANKRKRDDGKEGSNSDVKRQQR